MVSTNILVLAHGFWCVMVKNNGDIDLRKFLTARESFCFLSQVLPTRNEESNALPFIYKNGIILAPFI